MNIVRSTRLPDLLLVCAAAWALTGAGVEVYNVGWGTGIWLGLFSPKWAGAFFLYILFAVAVLTVGWIWLRTPESLGGPLLRIALWRDSLGSLRWLLFPLVLLAPIYLLQYTSWGYILHGPYVRVILASISVLLLGVLLTKTEGGFLDWTAGLAALAAVAGAVVFFSPLARVTDYPFSLGWSEGNRLWDYSILFGRHLYEYPDGETIPVYLDVGRQFIGGIPFLLPGLTIWQARLWLALVDIVPYLILGWVVFRTREKGTFWYWFLAGAWAFTFVAQGPIHPPLLLSAIVVGLAWGRPLWLAMLLVAGASLFATVSRFTWVFAPAMWAVMLEFSGTAIGGRRMDRDTWKRSAAVGLAGLAGGFGVHILFPKLSAWMSNFFSETGSGAVEAGAGLRDSVTSSISQGLLWYRLLPNETYPPGILIGLFFAIGPLVIILIHLTRSRRWLLNGLQQAALVLPLLAFLAVGLIVSTKIGGGGDLHNLDMLIIGLLFAGAIAWRNGARPWLAGLHSASAWTRLLVIALVVFPGYWRLLNLKPIMIHGNPRAVAVLADLSPLDPLPDPLPDTLPSEEDTLEALNGIRAEVKRAAPLGEILFTDQRQLLTFGYVPQVPLVPEYDKKVLIDKALSGDAEYFAGFYRDLADGRFSLIVSNPLNELVKTDPAEFGEENNAWVKWVSTPMLCYYEPLYTLRKVKVQILAPRQTDTSACAARLP
jgi:hypothetical protein